jgi:hypothetical protein
MNLMSKICKLAKNGLIFLLALAFWACAPQQPSPEAESTLESASIKPLQIATALPKANEKDQGVQPLSSTFDPKNPDWELRYTELYQSFETEFRTPTIGQSVTIELKGGQRQKGVINELTPTDVRLDIGNGNVDYPLESLSERSAAQLFKSSYARNEALKQGRVEFKRWQQMNQVAANPTAAPMENGVDAPDTGRVKGDPPKNEGSVGRVSQVDQYIRQNAAVPHSLRVKAWGQVQKHEKGYKVRVQYSLESANGFGTSNEDMMFFMYTNGRVYRKAPVK